MNCGHSLEKGRIAFTFDGKKFCSYQCLKAYKTRSKTVAVKMCPECGQATHVGPKSFMLLMNQRLKCHAHSYLKYFCATPNCDKHNFGRGGTVTDYSA